MNRFLTLLAALLALQADTFAAERVENQRKWTQRFELSDAEPSVEILNIWGDVRVLPGPEGEMTLSIREHRSAPTQALFDRSLEVFALNIDENGEGVSVRVGEWRQNWRGDNPCRKCRAAYEFEARVPPNTRLHVSTVNDGLVEVSGIAGRIIADNVNGPVTIRDARSCESVGSINGAVSLSFAAEPGSDCRIETINGDIDLQVPDGAGLDVAVDLGNGRVTTGLPVDPLAIPARVEHRESGGIHKYTIEQAAGIRLAGGSCEHP
jgi:hypothetical protein